MIVVVGTCPHASVPCTTHLTGGSCCVLSSIGITIDTYVFCPSDFPRIKYFLFTSSKQYGCQTSLCASRINVIQMYLTTSWPSRTKHNNWRRGKSSFLSLNDLNGDKFAKLSNRKISCLPRQLKRRHSQAKMAGKIRKSSLCSRHYIRCS